MIPQWGIISYQSEWLLSKNLQTINTGEGVEKKKPRLHCWWEGQLVQPLWRTVWRFLKKKKYLQDKFLGMKLICISIGDLSDFKTQPKFSSTLTIKKENLWALPLNQKSLWLLQFREYGRDAMGLLRLCYKRYQING